MRPSWQTRLWRAGTAAWPRAWWRRMPGSSASFGPPRRRASWADYTAVQGGRWIEARAAAHGCLPDPWLPWTANAGTLAQVGVHWPAMGVAVLRHGRLLQQAGFPVGADDTYLGEFMQRGLGDDSAVFTVARAPRRLRWPGRTLHLGNVSAGHNFYHWLIDAAGKAAVYFEAGLGWSDVDRVFLPRFDTAATRRLRAALGVPEDKVVTLAHDEQAECEELWLPTMPAPDRIVPRWLVAWWRSLLPIPANATGGGRLFLPRRGRRAPVDADGLELRLAARGFAAVEPADFERVVEQLAGAAFIVGVHGAGMANLIWARPGARVLEIVPDTHARPFYRGLAAAAGLDYAALVVPGGSGADENFVVSETALDQAVTAMLQEGSRA